MATEAALRALWQEAFEDSDAFLDCFFATAYGPDRVRCLYRDGRLAAALYWFDCDISGGRLAYLYAVATAAALRGRGLCHALLADTHAHLAAMGYQGTVLVPGSPSLFRLYREMGYAVCGTVGSVTCRAGDKAAPVRIVNRAEYAQLRRALLPAGGVRQEGENLAFLAAQAELYAGPDFLLAAQIQGDTLNGLELLGNSAAAPGILRALGCRQGVFRTPDGETPFAMYRPLRPGPAPTYFGLAFD